MIEPPTERHVFVASVWQEHSRDSLLEEIERHGATFLSMMCVMGWWDDWKHVEPLRWVIVYIHTEPLDYEVLC